MKLEEKLTALRKRKGLSQAELAEYMEVSRQAISRWEVGEAVPSTENLKNLSRLYDVTVDHLLDDSAVEPERGDGVLPEKTGGIGKRKTVVLLLAVLAILAVVLGVFLLAGGEDEVVEMEELSSDADWRSSEAEEFPLDW